MRYNPNRAALSLPDSFIIKSVRSQFILRVNVAPVSTTKRVRIILPKISQLGRRNFFHSVGTITASASRAAKSNLDEHQASYFIGMPTPANALFRISYCCGILAVPPLQNGLFYITLFFILVLSLLMVSEIPMFSLKLKKLSLKGNERQAILIVLMMVFVLLWEILGIAAGILAYIALSVIGHIRERKKHIE